MKRVLFVCTGNTCRSPMAECLFNALASERGLTNLCASSAGVYAQEGAPASTGARHAMRRRGLSLDRHCSRPVTEALLSEAACVVGMSESHLHALRASFPNVRVPMFAFDDPPIHDPFGLDDKAYEQAASDLERQLPALLERL